MPGWSAGMATTCALPPAPTNNTAVATRPASPSASPIAPFMYPPWVNCQSSDRGKACPSNSRLADEPCSGALEPQLGPGLDGDGERLLRDPVGEDEQLRVRDPEPDPVGDLEPRLLPQ